MGTGWTNSGRAVQLAALVGCLLLTRLGVAASADADIAAGKLLDRTGKNGLCVFLGLPGDEGGDTVVHLAQKSGLLLYVQSADEREVTVARHTAESAKLLGERLFVGRGPWSRIQLADNLADVVVVGASAQGRGGAEESEILRVLRPRGKAFFVGKDVAITKPVPEGVDSWSHPYHGPDNNALSKDRLARHPYLTHFLAEPMFGCMSTLTVGAGGRLFMAFGNTTNQRMHNDRLNTLLGINAYNGAVLWKRPLKTGFMIHRNTLIATPEVLYIADDTSCKLIDAATGELTSEIVLPAEIGDEKVWKWMGMENGVLYALLGGPERGGLPRPGTGPGWGHWPWKIAPAYAYPRGPRSLDQERVFGRRFVAFDPKTGKVLWHYRADAPVDGRGTCMKGKRIYFFCPWKSIACLDATSGKILWRRADGAYLKALKTKMNSKQGGWIGFGSSIYLTCNDEYVFLAGTQRKGLPIVAIRAKNGDIAWKSGFGNSYLILRKDALYAIGPVGRHEHSCFKMDYASGEKLASFGKRYQCTRASASVDSIFYRANKGTARYDVAANVVERMAAMRPPCHSGVIVSSGLLYWGPWICGCGVNLFGNVCLAPAGDFDFSKKADESEQLEAFGAGKPVSGIGGGQFTFTAGTDGVIRASKDGKPQWKAYTGGGINFPPRVWNGRVYVGSNDGRVYAWDAATGGLLWRFRAAPAERKIPVYGKLMSTWPVAGGVDVKDGVVYAAAGIAHHDGTHVYALDAVTGKIKWYNNSSGRLKKDINCGISVQGALKIVGSALTFHGGEAYPSARFDLKTGKCLTPPVAPESPNSPRGLMYLKPYLEKHLKSSQ